MGHEMNELGVLDTDFRSVIRRLHTEGRIQRVLSPIDPHLELSAFVKNLDGDLPFSLSGSEVGIRLFAAISSRAERML